MVGRKRVPTSLRVARGNPRGKPLPKHEPKPDLGAIMPDDLSDAAKRHWDVVSKRLVKFGILTVADSLAFEVYCELYVRWKEAERKLKVEGLVIHSKRAHRGVQSPYVTIANKTARELRMYMAEFGMTPSSRSRVVVHNPKGSAKKSTGRLRGLDDDDQDD